MRQQAVSVMQGTPEYLLSTGHTLEGSMTLLHTWYESRAVCTKVLLCIDAWSESRFRVVVSRPIHADIAV